MFCTVEPSPQQGHELDLLLAEGIGLDADDRDHPDRAGADEERRGETAAQAELAELMLFGVGGVLHVAPVDGLRACQNFLEHRARNGSARPDREDGVGAGARRRHHACSAVVGENDRRAVEAEESAQLPNERCEGLVEVERRPERPRAPVGGVEDVHAPAQLVAEALGFAGALLGELGLTSQAVDEPADDQAHQEPEPERNVMWLMASSGGAKRSARKSSLPTRTGSRASGITTPPTSP